MTRIAQGREGRRDTGGPLEVSDVHLSEERLRSSAEAIADGRPFALIHHVAFGDSAAARILTLLGKERCEASCRLFDRASDRPSLHAAHPRSFLIRGVNVRAELAVTDIALAVGYPTPSEFAASFRKAIGVTPSEFCRHL
jgi:AraC-like DNA-binding protein